MTTKYCYVKIQSIGALTDARKWFFNSYLTNRYQVVQIHGAVSDPLPAECGVTEGSILGPILFSIYVNDLPEVPLHYSTECYDDNTRILFCFFPFKQLPMDRPRNERITPAGAQLLLWKSAITESRQDKINR